MSEKTKYLYENKEIGDVLAQGFAKICQQKPQFPINYLARFLKNYTLNNQQKTQLIDKLEHNKLIDQKLKKLSFQNQSKQLAKTQTLKRTQEEKNKFLNSISVEKQPQSIINGFCEWVCSTLKLSAVYVGELEYQSKKIDLMNQDGEEAHLQLEKDKIVRFKYASNKQQGIIIGQSLGLQSVVGKLLTQVPQNQGQQGSPQDEDNAQLKTSQSENPSIYLPSVVGNQQLKFFTFPKLGAYFAAIMNVKSYLSEKLIDENVQKIQNYRKLLSQYDKEMEEKQHKFREQYEEKAHSGADQKQLQQMQHQFENEKNSTPKPTQEPFSFVQRKFIICADTMGQDKQITLEERNQLLKLIKHLKSSWQNQQQSQLTQDIQKQLSLFAPSHQQGHDGQAPNYQQQLTNIFEQEEKEIQSHQEVQRVKDNEKLLQLQLNTLRFQKTKQYLTEEKYLKFWNHLLSLNVLKYQQILKQYLILLGYAKEKFCIPNTNQLDWLKTKNLLKSSQTIINEKLHSLTPRGSKPQKIHLYAKCSRINKNLQNLEVLTIANYNIYLALILRLLQLYTKTRQQDRQARVIKISTQRQLRQQKLKQAQTKVNQKKQKLDTLKAQLQEKGELQTFDQQAWNNQFDEQNPPIEVPDQVPQDIDNDLEEVEEKQPNI